MSDKKPTCPVCGSQRTRHNRVPVNTAEWTGGEPELWIEGTLECIDCEERALAPHDGTRDV